MENVTLSTEQKLQVREKELALTKAELAFKEAAITFENKKNELLSSIQTIAQYNKLNYADYTFSLDTLEFYPTPTPSTEKQASN